MQITRKISKRALGAAAVLALAIFGAQLASAQTTKGQQQVSSPTSNTNNNNNNQQASRTSYSTAPSPINQLRNQQQAPIQQQQILGGQTSRPSGGSSDTKRRPQQPPQQQQQQQSVGYDGEPPSSSGSTEDPLADSEPAIYGSVAGQPGVDFPAYTRVPKTSFTCEGKGYDFGFYADEEAGCQVYHVCWEGRRESFLCGVGTVFNQAILACDYWHSVDCSKSSQFYGVNSELGKSDAVPATGSRRQQARQPAVLPSPPATSSQSPSFNTNQNQNQIQNQQQQQQQQPLGQNPISTRDQDQDSFGEPLNGVTRTPIQPIVQQQQQQYDDGSFDGPSQQQTSAGSRYGAKGSPATRATTPSTPTVTSFVQARQSYEFQQRIVHPPPQSDSGAQLQPISNTKNPPRNFVIPSTTPAAPAAKRPRFNMDFQQKVNSLIESPVRPPIKQASLPPVSQSSKGQQQQKRFEQVPSSPVRQQQSNNLGQTAVQKAQQNGSRKLNAGPSRKQISPAPQAPVQHVAHSVSSQPIVQQQLQQQPQQQQQQTFDNELDEPQVVQQQQQQQQLIDDSPVQTSTQANYGGKSLNPPLNSNNNNNNNIREQNFGQPQQGTTVIRAGNGLDGSSAITTQYDTMTPVGQQQQQLQNSPISRSYSSPSSENNIPNRDIGSNNNNNADGSYESSLDDSNSGANDDFRSAGAKAAASHNQNWYIMRSI